MAQMGQLRDIVSTFAPGTKDTSAKGKSETKPEQPTEPEQAPKTTAQEASTDTKPADAAKETASETS